MKHVDADADADDAVAKDEDADVDTNAGDVDAKQENRFISYFPGFWSQVDYTDGRKEAKRKTGLIQNDLKQKQTNKQTRQKNRK